MSTWRITLPWPIEGVEPTMRLFVPASVDRLEAMNQRGYALALLEEAQTLAIPIIRKVKGKIAALMAKHMPPRCFLLRLILAFNANRPQGVAPISPQFADAPEHLLAELQQRGLLERIAPAGSVAGEPTTDPAKEPEEEKAPCEDSPS